MNSLTKQKGSVHPYGKRSVKRITVVCPQCDGVHVDDGWHMPNSRVALLLKERMNRVTWQRCPVCETQNNGLFMGVLYVKNIPEDLLYLVAAFILHEAKRECLMDPQHRIVEFIDIIDGYKLTTTAASMAANIGEKIRATFDTTEVQSGHEHAPSLLTI